MSKRWRANSSRGARRVFAMKSRPSKVNFSDLFHRGGIRL